jgi:hypothetical protein
MAQNSALRGVKTTVISGGMRRENKQRLEVVIEEGCSAVLDQ